MKKYYFYRLLTLLLFIVNAIITVAQTSEEEFIDQKIDSIYANKNDSFFAFSSVELAIKSAEKINYEDGIAAATQLKGYLYLDYGNYDKAKKYLFDAYELNKKLNNDKVMAKNLRLIGIYYERKDDYSNALEYTFKSLQIHIKLNDKKGVAECNASIGIIYHYSSQIQKALVYYKKALVFYINTNNEKSINDINSNIGAAFNTLGKYDSAIYYINQVIINKTKTKENIGLGKAYHNLAITYSLQNKNLEAFKNCKRAIEYTGRAEQNDNNGDSYKLAGNLLFKLNRHDEAKKYLSISEKIFSRNNLQTELIENYFMQGELYEKTGDLKKSMYYNTLGNHLKDSVTLNENQHSINEIETKYKTLEKTKEIELLKAENKTLEQASKYNTVLAIGLFVLFVISAVLVLYLRVVKQNKRELHIKNKVIETKKNEAIIQNNSLEKLIEENQSLMGILAHDLRSPFGKIIGLINLLEDKDNNEEEKTLYINYINEICNDSLKLIQDTINVSQIYHDKSNENLTKMEVFIPSEIIENTINSFIAVAIEKQIQIKLNDEIKGISILSSKEYLSRILDNLLSNAIKFSPLNSSVCIDTKKEKNNLIISVKDNGPGLSKIDKENLFKRFKTLSAKPTGNEASSGLGLFIVNQLTELLGGNIRVNSELGNGAEFIITLPIKPNS
ncbi:MAG: tetratricopeptide repeat-containing sensor histidine kinase [Bacteroidia bacterium]